MSSAIPLDVAVSLTHHLGVTVDQAIELMADPNGRSFADPVNVEQYFGSWLLHVHSWTHAPDPSLHVICYEDMLTKPLTAFKGVAEFLGLEPPQERLAAAIELDLPVKAPFSRWYMFWAPNLTELPWSTLLTTSRDMNGGQTTFSTPCTASRGPTSSRASRRASSTVVFIFQLPATIGTGKGLPS